MAAEMITDRDFRKRVLNAREPALVAFTSRSCEASQELVPILDQVSERFHGQGTVYTIDLGENPTQASAGKLAMRYGVNRLPAVVAFSDGQPKDLIGGLTTAEDLADMLDRQVRPVREVIGTRNFKVEVLESKVPVLVHFHEADCDASIALLPILEDTANNFAGRAKVVRVETSVFNASIMERYGAIRTPMVAAFDHGELKDSIMGNIVGTKQLGEDDGRKQAVAHVSEMLEELL